MRNGAWTGGCLVNYGISSTGVLLPRILAAFIQSQEDVGVDIQVLLDEAPSRHRAGLRPVTADSC